MTSTSTSSEKHNPAVPAEPVEPSGPKATQAGPEPLPEHEPAAFGGEVVVHGEFPGQKQVRVIVSQTALEQIQTHAISDLEREVGGVLLGRACRHQAQTFLEVLAAMPVSTVDHGPVHFTFTADTWARMNHDRENQFPDLDVVGWFHTHPGLGVFYSSDDVVVHSAAFTLPWQVGLVVDPLEGEACFFGWEQTPVGREIMPIAGFYEWLDRRTGTILGWEVSHRPNWRDDSHVRLAGGGWPALPSISPWWGVFLGTLSLLISLGLLLERLLSR